MYLQCWPYIVSYMLLQCWPNLCWNSGQLQYMFLQCWPNLCSPGIVVKKFEYIYQQYWVESDHLHFYLCVAVHKCVKVCLGCVLTFTLLVKSVSIHTGLQPLTTVYIEVTGVITVLSKNIWQSIQLGCQVYTVLVKSGRPLQQISNPWVTIPSNICTELVKSNWQLQHISHL